MHNAKMFTLALAMAAGAFVLTMVKDPPKSAASNPSAATTHAAADLPALDCFSTSTTCP